MPLNLPRPDSAKPRFDKSRMSLFAEFLREAEETKPKDEKAEPASNAEELAKALRLAFADFTTDEGYLKVANMRGVQPSPS